ncbi:SDR family NAD(P)-dependent oxidoreductase [Marinimicrobium alkaliphilum]|uniref:SDR family NAD(P)-dependent oxidoreductase n=1 Tax=Marinimicrobium alkaliphilum TaxID=2202654 RepID=UPI000DBAA524|nr:SDR family NAD(P)-dependent oxidoreductase [Marinimicrobium alkaliphilum]
MMQSTRYPSLDGKVVFITGGATGIGEALVEAFVEQGCCVSFIDLQAEVGKRLCARLTERFGEARVHFYPGDVTKSDDLREVLALTKARCGDVQILINNVANDQRFDTRTLSAESWYRSLAVNLDPAFFASQAVYPMMARSGGGAVINFSSINAICGSSNMASYNAAKAGLIGLTKSLARDFGGDNIRVNTILPGWVVTERQLNKWLTPEAEQEWMNRVCLKERILPSDVANMALFLASDDARMITGQKFVIDGGRL